MADVEQTVCLQCNLALPYSEKNRRTLNFRLLNCKCHIVFRKAFVHYEILLCTGSNELFEDLAVKATTYIQHPTKPDQLLAGQEVTLSGNRVKLWVETVNTFMQKFPIFSETAELKIVIILTGIPVTTSGLSTDGASLSQVVDLREADGVQQLVEILSTLLHDTKRADVLIQCCDGKTLWAHSWMLAVRCSYFDENLNRKKEDGIFKLEVDVDEPTMRHVQRYIYLAETPALYPELACALHDAAERFSLQGLKNKCWEWTSNNINSENFITFLTAAHKCKNHTFKNAAIAFISHHREVFKGDSWMNFIDPNNLAVEVLMQIVTSPSRQRTPS